MKCENVFSPGRIPASCQCHCKPLSAELQAWSPGWDSKPDVNTVHTNTVLPEKQSKCCNILDWFYSELTWELFPVTSDILIWQQIINIDFPHISLKESLKMTQYNKFYLHLTTWYQWIQYSSSLSINERTYNHLF